MPERPTRKHQVLFLLVLAAFFLKDFVFMASQTAEEWLAADYGSKIVGLLLAGVCALSILTVDPVVTETRDYFPRNSSPSAIREST